MTLLWKCALTGLLVAAIGLVATTRSIAASAKDGQGNLTVSPAAVNASSTNNFLFTFRVNRKPFNPGSQFTIQIPAAWSAPQTSNATGPGFISVTPVLNTSTASLTAITGTGPWTLFISFSTSQNQAGFTIGYQGAIAPTNAGIFTFTAQTKQSGGALRTLRSGSPSITVDSLSKTNTTTSLVSALNPSTYGDSVSFTATVIGSGAPTPTGTLTFKEGDVVLGTAPLNASAQASFTTNRFSVPDSPCWITAQYSGDPTFNPSVSTVLLQTVNSATVTVSGIAAQNKVYDGATLAALNFNNTTLAGALPGDDVTLDSSSAAGDFADPNAGPLKPVAVSGLALLGADSGNYIVGQVTGVSANILAAPLTVTANDTNKFFGDPNPPFTATYTGFVPGDDWRVLRGTPAFSTTAAPASPVAGNPYLITATNGTLTAVNYSFVFAPGQLTILPKPVQPQKIVSISKLENGTVSLTCSGAAGQAYLLQASVGESLSSWTTIATNTTDAAGFMNCVDTAGTNLPSRFYRTALP